MVRAVGVVVAAMLVALVASRLSPLTPGDAQAVVALSLLGVAVSLAGWAIGRWRGSRRHGSPPPAETLTSATSLLRIVLVAGAVIVAEKTVVSALPGVTSSFVLVEATYYAVLLVAGALLATWCRAPFVAPPLVALVAFVVLGTLDVLAFVGSPGVDFQFGPEKWLFAFGALTGKAAMLPLDVGAIVASWQAFSPERLVALTPRSGVTGVPTDGGSA